MRSTLTIKKAECLHLFRPQKARHLFQKLIYIAQSIILSFSSIKVCYVVFPGVDGVLQNSCSVFSKVPANLLNMNSFNGRFQGF